MPTIQASKWSYILDEPTRILIVDDDPLLREFASVYLSTPAAQVETAADGAAGLDLLLERTFDIALIDILMPGLDGFELVERARAHPSLRNLPLVMLTGREDIASIDRAYTAGATSFVTKPVNWRQLSYQLRYVLRSSRMETEVRRARLCAEENARHKSNTLCRLEEQCRVAMTSIIALADLVADGDKLPLPHVLEYGRNISAAGQQLLNEILKTTTEADLPHLRERAGSTGREPDEKARPREAAA
jgi:DNA-binding response OmpR family regulator